MRAQLQSLTDFKRACAGQPIEFRIASGNSVAEWLLVPKDGQARHRSAISTRGSTSRHSLPALIVFSQPWILYSQIPRIDFWMSATRTEAVILGCEAP